MQQPLNLLYFSFFFAQTLEVEPYDRIEFFLQWTNEREHIYWNGEIRMWMSRSDSLCSIELCDNWMGLYALCIFFVVVLVHIRSKNEKCSISVCGVSNSRANRKFWILKYLSKMRGVELHRCSICIHLICWILWWNCMQANNGMLSLAQFSFMHSRAHSWKPF